MSETDTEKTKAWGVMRDLFPLVAFVVNILPSDPDGKAYNLQKPFRMMTFSSRFTWEYLEWGGGGRKEGNASLLDKDLLKKVFCLH